MIVVSLVINDWAFNRVQRTTRRDAAAIAFLLELLFTRSVIEFVLVLAPSVFVLVLVPLAIVVPLILAIIGMLLFFALRSARDAAVIFSGVPLAHQRRIGFVDPRNSFIDLCAYRISVARNAAR